MHLLSANLSGKAHVLAMSYTEGSKLAEERQSMRISVRVIPRSSRNSLEWDKGSMQARLTAPPVDGAANAALVALLSKQLNLPRRSIEIVRGATGKQKLIEITGLTLEEVEQRIMVTS